MAIFGRAVDPSEDWRSIADHDWRRNPGLRMTLRTSGKSYNEGSSLSAQRKVGASSTWGRHGFDGIACGREACRGVDTRNRSQNYKCR